jgi:hypothetical protein
VNRSSVKGRSKELHPAKLEQPQHHVRHVFAAVPQQASVHRAQGVPVRVAERADELEGGPASVAPPPTAAAALPGKHPISKASRSGPAWTSSVSNARSRALSEVVANTEVSKRVTDVFLRVEGIAGRERTNKMLRPSHVGQRIGRLLRFLLRTTGLA